MKSKFFDREDLEGPRRSKLELEDFREVDFRYPAKLVWWGTSLSNRYLDEQEVSRQTRFQVKKVQLPDGIHLWGPRGRYAFTKAAIEMLNIAKGTTDPRVEFIS